MEGQPDAERRNPDRADSEKEPAEDEWKSLQRGQVRNTLYLVSAAAQWTLLLACFVYLGIHSLQPSTPQNDQVPWAHIRYTGQSLKGVAVNFTTEGGGSIQIRNGSIMITCDGLYLVSLKGKILLPDLKEADLLKLTLGKMEKTTNTSLWEQTVQDSSEAVNLTTVLFLFDQDNIVLWTSCNAIISDLTFSLVLVSPFTCLP